MKTLLHKWLFRSHCQICSWGFYSVEAGGKGNSVTFFGKISFLLVCHPALSMTITACLPVDCTADISFRCNCIASVQAGGNTNAAFNSLLGQTAPKIYAYSNCCCFTALGLVPFSAHILEIVPCWPILASSWNQISTSDFFTVSGIASPTNFLKFF